MQTGAGNRPGGERPDDASEKPLPLSGIRVIDVGTFLAGPYAASIMGEFGAEVLKIEHPVGGTRCATSA